jgi:hypothetical protein
VWNFAIHAVRRSRATAEVFRFSKKFAFYAMFYTLTSLTRKILCSKIALDARIGEALSKKVLVSNTGGYMGGRGRQGQMLSATSGRQSLRQMTVAVLGFALTSPSFAVPVAPCFEEASARFGHANPNVLRALAQQESSGKCTRRHPVNQDGSYDIGCMGINSSWLPKLQKQFGITEQDLYDPCTNLHVGAWIHAKNVRQFGDNWRAIGAFNARSEPKRIAYAWKINSQLHALR